MAKNEFDLKNLPEEVKDPSITKDDFKFVQQDTKIHDTKFETKPTTFFKDSIKRFAKNKSSVVATGILGFLLLLSIFVPIFGKTNETHDTSKSHSQIYWLEPKLFNPKKVSFWNGTKKVKNIPVDVSSDPEGVDKEANWWPDPTSYEKGAILNKTFTDEQYTSEATTFGKGGYLQFGYYSNVSSEVEFVQLTTPEHTGFDMTATNTISTFDVYDAEKLSKSAEDTKDFPSNYVEAEAAMYFVYGNDYFTHYVELTEYKTVHNVGVGDESIDVNAAISKYYVDNPEAEHLVDTDSYHFEIRVKNRFDERNNCILVRSVVFGTTSADSTFKYDFETPSFNTGNEVNIRTSDNNGYWTCFNPGLRKTYLSKAVLCSFTYDTYEALLGHKWLDAFPVTKLKEYKRNGWLTYSYEYEFNVEEAKYVIKPGTWQCTVLDTKKCPLAEEGIAEEDVVLTEFGDDIKQVSCYVMKYKYDFGLEKMPKFLLGTDKSGRDMFIYVFEGLRTSLILGILTTAVCFLFGLFWGSVSGYFGGNVDLAMERFTDILSGIPWIVVMTLVIINMGSTFFTFALALCMTGWIGTAATTRTQFYRFRGREYVLASRTLGASNARLIAKHILPNAMGTIITSAVLMVPSVIFSEATISYLGLGFKNLASLGVILSDNQVELTNHPYLLIFPSVVIALVMISFNLFGNGLRDAVNPSLKGEGE